MSLSPRDTLRLALPKGRMREGIFDLLKAAGVKVHVGQRGYRPVVSLPDTEAKLLKPQNVIEMLHVGSRDVGFAGADWVAELGAELVEILDTELDPVRLVAAAPERLLVGGALPPQPLIVASEYEQLTRRWIRAQGLEARFVRSYGATEVFPPEDADCIVDNTATGATLAANQLRIIDELLRSSTRLYANPRALDNPEKRRRVEDLALLLRAVLDARRRVMLEVNVSAERLEALIAVVPCMREPTLAPLHRQSGFALKAAVPREALATLIPTIKACGGTDIVVSEPAQIVA